MHVLTVVTIPPARAEGLLVERIGDETVVYDLETKNAHCLKALAAVVFECCDGHATIEQIAAIASERLGVHVTESEVADAAAQLEDRQLLDVPLVVHQHNGDDHETRTGFSRREMVRKTVFAGAASALAGSLITTIGTPPAFAGSSQIATGCTGCGQNKDCVSNHCCQSVAGKSCLQTCCVGADNSCHLSTTTSGNSCTVNLASGSCPCTCGAPGCTGPCCKPGTATCCSQTCTGSTGSACTTAGLTCCSGFCVDLHSDVLNCGTCGHACTGSQTCVNGTCQ